MSIFPSGIERERLPNMPNVPLRRGNGEPKQTLPLSPSSSSTVSPAVGDEVPDGAEEEPRDGVGHDEDEERAAPVEVHQRGEDVRQVAVGLAHVAVLHVAVAVLLHVALPLTPGPAWGGAGL